MKLHQVLIPFPLGLLATSFFFDAAWLLFGGGDLPRYAGQMILAGVIAALIAAAFGVRDYRALTTSELRGLGIMHGAGNVLVLVLFSGSWVLRRSDPSQPGAAALAMSGIALALIVVTGWLGGRLAERAGHRSDAAAEKLSN